MRTATQLLTGAMLLSTVPHPTEAARRAPDDKDSAIRGAMMGSLVADALTLGTHYEYDAEKIEKFYGGLDRYYAPGEKTGGQTHGVGWGARNFHGGNGNGPAKRAGEQTDYGDYNILVLGARRTGNAIGPGLTLWHAAVTEHLADTASNPHPFELSEFIPTWQKRLRSWRAWMCTQTRQTLQQVCTAIPGARTHTRIRRTHVSTDPYASNCCTLSMRVRGNS
eukprot:COSAG01_NODE_1418_length_10375_cov_38.842254_2_plen_222_part_00